jgi:hypothetical protein
LERQKLFIGIKILESNVNIPPKEEMISRKEAIIRVGKYAAFTAAAMMLVLAPMESSAAKKSPKPPRGNGGKK